MIALTPIQQKVIASALEVYSATLINCETAQAPEIELLARTLAAGFKRNRFQAFDLGSGDANTVVIVSGDGNTVVLG